MDPDIERRDRRRGWDGRETTPSRGTSQSWALVVLLSCTLAACAVPEGDAKAGPDTARDGDAPAEVRAGVQVLLSDSLSLVRGKRVGLITNHSVFIPADGDGSNGNREPVSTIDALFAAPGVELVRLFGPEHGIRGEAQAGAHIEDGQDEKTGLPVFSLYGETRRPTPEMLEGIDVLVFDMEDVGARYYTYPSTMAYAMEAAGQAGIPFVVLDRPNPIRGDVVQGNVLDTAYSTFVGLYPEPMRHGMTMGELARMFVGAFGVRVELHVVPMDGWHRDMTFDQTGLPWVPPSPNIPSLESALAYPGTCLFEGTPLSVGRGTDRAFQQVGAPWLDGQALADTLNGYHLEGLRFVPVTFTPHGAGDGKFNDTEVHGVRLVGATSTYDAPRAAVAMLVETYRMSGDHWSWNVAHIDRLAGTDALRRGIDAGKSMAELTADWDSQLSAFRALRAPYLLYR
ncbi:MAG: DUF1343 domain-containing protein [Gemmatimonadota bacterium]